MYYTYNKGLFKKEEKERKREKKEEYMKKIIDITDTTINGFGVTIIESKGKEYKGTKGKMNKLILQSNGRGGFRTIYA